MEERRKEARELLRIEEGRKKEAKKKEESWAFLRTSIAFLKEQEWKWKQRQIEEVERIKEEEKADRLAVLREKKKIYGISKLSKEENQRLKLRTEDRLTVAKAKENLWKRFRDKDMMKEMQEDEVRAWEDIQRMIIELEEEGSWRNEDKNIKDIKIREGRLKVITESGMSGKSESKSPQIIGKVKTMAFKLELESNGEKSTSVRVGKKKEDRTELESVRERILSSKRVGEPKKSKLEAVKI